MKPGTREKGYIMERAMVRVDIKCQYHQVNKRLSYFKCIFNALISLVTCFLVSSGALSPCQVIPQEISI